MRSHAQIREKAQEICAELAALMIEVGSSPVHQSATLEELRATYGHAERVLATLQQNHGRDFDTGDLTAKRLLLANGFNRS